MAELVPAQSPLGANDDAPNSHGLTAKVIERALSVQRPIVLAHIRSLRTRHPNASPAELLFLLERRYLAGVTTGGAAVGAAAVVPGVGTGISLGLSGAETIGFLEATALYAQSVAEIHGLATSSPERSRALVMALMLGEEGVTLVRHLAAQAVGKGVPLSSHWGNLITTSLPKAMVGPMVDQLKKRFVHHFAVRAGTGMVGRVLPFGIGAAIGGVGNHLLGRRVVGAARRAFGEPGLTFPSDTDPKPGARPWEKRIGAGAKDAGAGAIGTVRKALTRGKRRDGHDAATSS